MRRIANIGADARAGQEGPVAAAYPHAHYWLIDAANHGRCRDCPVVREFHPETTTSGWEYREERDPPPQIHRPPRRRPK